jgi:hypothetical protein
MTAGVDAVLKICVKSRKNIHNFKMRLIDGNMQFVPNLWKRFADGNPANFVIQE